MVAKLSSYQEVMSSNPNFADLWNRKAKIVLCKSNCKRSESVLVNERLNNIRCKPMVLLPGGPFLLCLGTPKVQGPWFKIPKWYEGMILMRVPFHASFVPISLGTMAPDLPCALGPVAGLLMADLNWPVPHWTRGVFLPCFYQRFNETHHWGCTDLQKPPFAQEMFTWATTPSQEQASTLVLWGFLWNTMCQPILGPKPLWYRGPESKSSLWSSSNVGSIPTKFRPD